MFNTFSALKANDMVWRYFVDSYMLGKKPAAHEILFWNSDPINLTESMQSFLSQKLYRDNLLKAGTLKLFGVPLNLKLVKGIPLYMISTEKDHIVPWKAAYSGIKLFGDSVRFVLGGSGHVAGAINHPSRNKYCYWVNDKVKESAEEWFKTATKMVGSWWNDWIEWVKPMMGEMVDARKIGKFLRDAPGVYVSNFIAAVTTETAEARKDNSKVEDRGSIISNDMLKLEDDAAKKTTTTAAETAKRNVTGSSSKKEEKHEEVTKKRKSENKSSSKNKKK